MEGGRRWTWQENKVFENALAIYNETEPDFFHSLAKAVGNKTVEEVQQHYERLVHDIKLIESGKVPLPNYRTGGSSTGQSKLKDDKELRMKHLKLQ